MTVELTPVAVSTEHDWVRVRTDVVVPLINEMRWRPGERFDMRVSAADEAAYREAVDAVFADGEVGANATAYVRILRQLDVQDDYLGLVVGEVFGRELAATIAGGEPLRLLVQATFYFADVVVHTDGPVGCDDLDAAFVVGLQTRLPEWSWREGDSPLDSWC